MVRALIDLWRHSPVLFAWVNVLFTVNLAPLLWLYKEPSSLAWVGLALGVGPLAVNLAYIVANRGMANFMSVPHLIGWIPLHAYLLWQLASAEHSGWVWGSILAVLAVNTISLPFDVRDGLKWWRGERDLLFQPS